MTNDRNNDFYRGKRYICLARESDDSQGQASTEAQAIYVRNDADKRGMVFVDSIALKGVTGSLPGRRQDLEDLLRRKREKNDFDVIVVQRSDRLTRGGANHGFWFEYECQRVGVSVLFVGDDIPEGRYASLIKVAKYEAAQEQAFSISQRSTQGSQFALENGRIITCSRTPFGCWRLYLTAEGTPSHFIRDCGDGRQQKLHPETRAVIDTYGSVGGGSKGHYRKQKAELVLLAPGDPDEIEVVREIFHLHFIDGWGGKRIADRLNSRGVASPDGKQWSQRQVEAIYEQEAYTGRSVGKRISLAIYHERNPQAPRPVNLDPAILATARTPPKRLRPRDEWHIQDQPRMEDFLSVEVRALARAAHEDLWRRRSDPDRPKKSKNKHKDSEYILTGLLAAKQDGEPLTGVLCGPAGKRVRYYRHKRSQRGYLKGSVFNAMFPAAPLENEILRVLREVLADLPNLRERVRAFVEAEANSSRGDEPKVEGLRQRRDQLDKKLNLILSALDEETLAVAKAQIDQIKAERRAIEEELVAAASSRITAAADPDVVVEQVVADLLGTSEAMPSLPPHLLRQVLANLVGRLVGDMETKDVEVEFVLPSWAIGAQGGPHGKLRLVTSPGSSTSYETQQRGVALGGASCRYVKGHRSVCFECRRKPRAA